MLIKRVCFLPRILINKLKSLTIEKEMDTSQPSPPPYLF